MISIEEIIAILVMLPIGVFFFLMTNWIYDGVDMKNFCNSILPLDTFENYTKNKLENEYCYRHVTAYGYQDRYFDIPPRDYK